MNNNLPPYIRMFISSTFADMENERTFFNKVIAPELARLSHDRGVSFFSIDLELIRKLFSMNCNNFSPNNNGTGKLNQSQIILFFFLITNQQFTETIQKRMCYFNDPSSCFEIGIVDFFFFFFIPRTDMKNVPAV